jgi:hypothetical protein
MKIVCPYTFKGLPELDTGRTLWSFIANADKLSCVLDGDAIQVAAIKCLAEVPLVEVGVGLWHKHHELGEVVASFAAFNGESYRSRVRLFANKPITWLG